jgi:hypothetical protein
MIQDSLQMLSQVLSGSQSTTVDVSGDEFHVGSSCRHKAVLTDDGVPFGRLCSLMKLVTIPDLPGRAFQRRPTRSCSSASITITGQQSLVSRGRSSVLHSQYRCRTRWVEMKYRYVHDLPGSFPGCPESMSTTLLLCRWEAFAPRRDAVEHFAFF